MLVPGQLSVLFFHIGVALIAILPRLPNDRPFPLAIGGNLSYNFRRVMLGLVSSNIIRILCFEDPRFIIGQSTSTSRLLRLGALAYLLLKALESFLRSFLCLLTPYLMQCQLQNRINITQPGRELMMWVYLVVIVSVVGCLMMELSDDPRYWLIKEVGDALSFVPVYQTLKLYSAIISPGGRYPKRGDMTVQTLLIVEYLALVGTLLSAASYLWIKDTRPLFEAMRQVGSYLNLTRLLCHAMFMNARDEAEYYAKFATATSGSSDVESGSLETSTLVRSV